MGCGSSRAVTVGTGANGGYDQSPDVLKRNKGANAPYEHGSDASKASVSGNLSAAVNKKSSLRASLKSGDNTVLIALRSKRRGIMVEGTSVQVDVNYRKKLVPKAESIQKLIASALRDNLLFAALGPEEMTDIVNAMEPKQVSAGSVIIRQGEPGDNFYVIESGKFDILVGNKKVADWGDGTKYRSVGELALLYNAPRAATVRATTDAKLWAIDRVTFRHIIANASHASHERMKANLRRGILEDLSDEQIDKVATAATIVRFRKGEQIIWKGEEGETFYIIQSGSVICKNLPGDQANNVLHEGDYFGERALLKKEPRACDIFAHSEKVELIALHREDFEQLLGHLRELLEYNLGMRLLLCVPILASLPDSDRTTLFQHLRLVRYKPDQVILGQGMAVTQFFIIREGTVVVRAHGADSSYSVGRLGSKINLLANASMDRINTSEMNEIIPNSRPSSALNANPRLLDYNHPNQIKELGTLTAGQWFGENEAEEMAASPVTYVAKGYVQCFVLDSRTYSRILVPIANAMKAEAKMAASNRSSKGQRGDDRSSPEGGASPHNESYSSPKSNAVSNEVQQAPHDPPYPTSRDDRVAVKSPASRDVVEQDTWATSRRGSVLSQKHPLALRPPRERLGIPYRELVPKDTIGTGTFGRVKLVHHPRTARVFALKILQKAQIFALKQQANIMNEKELLMRINHPFIIKLYDTYKDKDRLYMLMELVQGGELFSRLQSSSTTGRVSPAEARFYAGCVLDAFEHLHSMNIVYRDLKVRCLFVEKSYRSFYSPLANLLTLICSLCSRKICSSTPTGTSKWSTLVLRRLSKIGHTPSAVLQSIWLQKLSLAKVMTKA